MACPCHCHLQDPDFVNASCAMARAIMSMPDGLSDAINATVYEVSVVRP